MYINEVNTGDKFSARIQGQSVTGTINISLRAGTTRLHLCQNKKAGDACPDKHGHTHSWNVNVNQENGLINFAGDQVTHFKITKKAIVKKKAAAKKAVAPTTPVATLAIPLTVDEEIAKREREIAALKAKKAAAAIPSAFRGWKISESGGRYAFGCGEVNLTKDQIASWLGIMNSMIGRVIIGVNLEGGKYVMNKGLLKDHFVMSIQGILDAMDIAKRILGRK